MSSSTTSPTATPPTASPDALAAQNELPIESHPFAPFLPENGRMLFLGSFPPTENRWCMHFYYPNFINDFWRIMGHLFFDDRQHFVIADEKRFDEAAIRRFAAEEGLAFFDTARRIRRLKGNASDAFLEVVEATDISSLLAPMPHCNRIVTTGGLAGKVLCDTLGVSNFPRSAPSCTVRPARTRWVATSTSGACPPHREPIPWLSTRKRNSIACSSTKICNSPHRFSS